MCVWVVVVVVVVGGMNCVVEVLSLVVVMVGAVTGGTYRVVVDVVVIAFVCGET